MTADTTNTKIYDYLILGGGAAGLSVAVGLARAGKSIAIIEKEVKNQNDRTWSFWESGAGQYDDIIHHSWSRINFYANQSLEGLSMDGYRYKMVRSADFYRKLHGELRSYEHVDLVQDEVIEKMEKSDYVDVSTKLKQYRTKVLLDSVTIPSIDQEKTVYVAQHFGGWFIKSETPCFDQDTATLMDFRIDQAGETRFFYVLPTSPTEALIEIAIFSNDILSHKQYDKHIRAYIDQYLDLPAYHISEKEYGVIPMTSYAFEQHNTDRIIHIGTSGGWVKPSSGYAFKRIQEKSELLVRQLIDGSRPNVESTAWYKWMDCTMLKAILYNYTSGKDVFDSLFGKLAPAEVFQFLDEKSSPAQILKIMSSSPIVPLSRAALARPW